MANASRVQPDAGPGLKARDIQILRLVFEGKSNKEIAALLSFSHGTVRVYVSHILAKLGVSNRSAAAFTALELGLIGPVQNSQPAAQRTAAH